MDARVRRGPTVPKPVSPGSKHCRGVWLGRLSKNCMNCMNIVPGGGVCMEKSVCSIRYSVVWILRKEGRRRGGKDDERGGE